MIRTILALALFLLASVASGQTRHENPLANECKPISFIVEVTADDVEFAADARQRLSTLVETRLRSARLYNQFAHAYLSVSLVFIESRVGFGETLSGYAGSFDVNYRSPAIVINQPIADPEIIYPFPVLVTIWDRSGITIGPSDGQPDYTIEAAMSRVDQFILEYLRANEAFCT